ncbi:MAG TPA: class I SAM-dependent methyltransferase [Mycobacteriales bacterium]|jgi:ubiquinone/menaquinone biosynthesis C-methylase UbiE
MPHGHGFRHLFMHRDGSMTGWFGDPEHYDRFATRFERRLRTRIATDVAALRLPSGAHVLDVGTGPGRLPVEIARHNPQVWVTGLDVSPRMIEAAKAAIEPGQQVIAEVGDVAKLPYRDGSVDLIVSTLSQHHWPDRAAALAELARVLAPGGRIWIYDLRGALRTAQGAAAAAFPGADVRVERVRAGVFGRLLARLTVQPAGVTV